MRFRLWCVTLCVTLGLILGHLAPVSAQAGLTQLWHDSFQNCSGQPCVNIQQVASSGPWTGPGSLNDLMFLSFSTCSGSPCLTVTGGGTVSVFNVTSYGAKCDGTTNDLTAFNSAATAATAVGGVIYVPPGTCVLSGAFTLPGNTSLLGSGILATTLQFTGATDGIVISSTYAQFSIRDITIQTTNASGGKAINVSNKSFGASKALIDRVVVNATGSGVWAFGLWGTSFQTSVLRALIVNNSTIGIHCEYACNALNFYGVEVVGGTGINRAIELQAASGSGGSLVFEQYWYGGTTQGSFAQSALNFTGVNPKVFGMHIENLNASPSDGADIVLNGTSVNASFIGMQGGSFLTSGTIRNLNIAGGEHGAITIAAGAVAASLIGARVVSLTDNGNQTTVFNLSDTTGAQLSNKIVGPLLASNASTFPAVGTLNPSAFLTAANGTTFESRDSGGTTQSILLPLTAADDTYVQYKTGHSLNLRSTAGGAAQLRVEEGRILLTQPLQTTQKLQTYNNLGPSNGQLLIGNATNGLWDAATVTAGTNIVVTNAAGSVTVGLSATPTITGGSITGLTTLAIRDTSAALDVTLAATSSPALTAGHTLTLNMGNVDHTLALGTTANTITFPNTASGTVPLLNFAQTFTANQTFSGTVTITNGSTGALVVDTSTLTVDATNHRVGFLTTAPLSVHEVNANVTAMGSLGGLTTGNATPAGTNVRVAGVDAAGANFVANTWAAASQFIGVRADGTAASPTALSANDIMFQMGGRGYDATNGYSTSAAVVRFSALNSWTATDNSTQLIFITTPSGSRTVANGMILQSGLQIGAPTGGDKGAGTLNAAGAYWANGTAGVTAGSFGTITAITATNGLVTQLTGSSDERLKDITGSFGRGLAALRDIHPITFHWNETTGFPHDPEWVGFSAQNVQQTIPEAIGTETWQDGHQWLTLNDRAILAASVNAIHELETRLETVEAKCNAK